MTSETTETTPLTAQIRAWQQGIGPELRFWERWFQTRGAEWPEDFQERLRLDTEITGLVMEGLGSGAKVLDVGSGPLTRLGKVWKGERVDIVPTDPLAPFYLDMAERSGVQPPIPVQQAFAEDLSHFHAAESFDAVYCVNALDHSFDPVRGIEEMLIVVKPGRRVVLQHATNEAEHEHYVGLHQWNFDEEDGQFIIWNRAQRVSVNDRFRDWADLRVAKHGRSLTVVLTKKGPLDIDLLDRSHTRIRQMLQAILTVGTEPEPEPAAPAEELQHVAAPTPVPDTPTGLKGWLRNVLGR